jgi:UDP-3-O-[3-hydroxymyristoyl] glucosamine N-acyltransferase LpxD
VKSVEISTEQITAFLGTTSSGSAGTVDQVAPLNDPTDGALTFAIDGHSDLLPLWAGHFAIVIAPHNAPVPLSCAHIVSSNPRGDYARIVRHFFAPEREIGISDSSSIHPSVQIDRDVFIGHNVVIESGVVIGSGVSIGHNTVILENVVIGSGVSIGHNTVIGSIGFGLEQDENGDWIRIPHLGTVVIEDEVEVGSSSVIARGTIKETRICRNCKIDDNVFIAHNVHIGTNSVVIANAEISGSVEIGKDCWIGPAVTVLEKITIHDGAMIGIGSVVIRDVPPNAVVVGNPGKVLRDR